MCTCQTIVKGYQQCAKRVPKGYQRAPKGTNINYNEPKPSVEKMDGSVTKIKLLIESGLPKVDLESHFGGQRWSKIDAPIDTEKVAGIMSKGYPNEIQGDTQCDQK